MTYMILDSAGNAVASYDDEIAAHAALRSIADKEPDAADHVLLVAFDDDGNPMGPAVTVADLHSGTAALDKTPVATTLVASAVLLSETIIASIANRYVPTGAPAPWRPKIDERDPNADVAGAH